MREITGLREIKRQPGTVPVNLEKRLGDMVQPPKDSNDRLGCVIIVGDSPAQAKERVTHAVQSIGVDIETS